jgi:dinuclear metal center YbgI/SA1388 family protein
MTSTIDRPETKRAGHGRKEQSAARGLLEGPAMAKPGRTQEIKLETVEADEEAAAMRKAPLTEMVRYCDRILRTAKIHDYENAVNGLQVENRGSVSRIAATVDASLSTIKLALASRADLLIVHHGLFWSVRQPWTGSTYEMLRLLVGGKIAVYSSHLPLDLHPKLGNNAQLCSALGFDDLQPFFFEKEQHIGLQTRARISLEDLKHRLHCATGAAPLVVPGGPSVCERIGVVTGGAGSYLKQAAAEGVDTFITGEGPHWTYAMAEELGINVLYGGHYATETFGVKALAAHLSNKFHLPWNFIDHPTGL